MKAKLKGQGGIKGLVLLHGEKALVALVAIGALYLGYSALGVERLPDQYDAAKLHNDVQQTKSNIESAENNWGNAVRSHPEEVRLDVPLKSEAMMVDHQAFSIWDEGLNPDVIAKRTPRTDPTLLAAVDVRTHSGGDLIPLIDPEYARNYQSRIQLEAARKEAEQKRQQDLNRNDAGGGRGGGRRNRRDEEDRSREFDPDHPNRRRIGSTSNLQGAQLQGSELIKFSRWVSVVAKVPIKNQIRMYRDAFENTSGGYNPDKDFPLYRGYLVERAEIVPGQEALQWQAVPVYDPNGTYIGGVFSNHANGGTLPTLEDLAATKWARGGLAEVVDLRFLCPEGLAYPLPPLVGREWGRDATHPDIPLATDAVLDAGSIGVGVDGTTTPAAAADEGPGAGGFGAAGARFGGGGRSARGEYQDPGMGRGGGGRGWGRSYDDGGRGSGRGYEVMDSGRGGRSGATQSLLPLGVNDYLLRFFDFNVEPGKRYSYRVRLVIIDPNWYLFGNPNVLDPKVLERLRSIPKDPQTGLPATDVLLADWSEPSPPVGVPLDGRVRLAGVIATGDEPRANLLVEGFSRSPESTSWIQASTVKPLSRGSIANFVEDAEYIIEQQTHIDRIRGFQFTTGVTVLDMRGGERLPGRNDLLAPARVLLMGPAGELSIRHETDDAPQVQLRDQLFAKPKPGDDRQSPDAGRGRG